MNNTQNTSTRRLFIRDFDLDRHGDLWVTASEVGNVHELAEGEDVSLKIGHNHPQRNELFKQLQSSHNQLANFEIRDEAITPDPDEPGRMFYAVRTVTGILDDQSRKRPTSRYTEELESRLGEYYVMRTAEESAKTIGNMAEAPEAWQDSIRKHALDRFRRTIKDPRTKDQIPGLAQMTEQHLDELFQAESRGKENLTEILRAEERSQNGPVQIGYDADHSFALQSQQRSFSGIQDGLSAAVNYAYQAAVADTLQEAIGSRGERGVPFIETEKNRLISENVLLEGHPTYGSEEYKLLAQEYAQITGGNILKAMSAKMGAAPSNSNIPLQKAPDSPEGAFQAGALEKIPSADLSTPERLAKAMVRMADELSQNAELRKEQIDVAQTRAMNPGESREIPLIEQEDKEMVTQVGGNVSGQVADLLDAPSMF